MKSLFIVIALIAGLFLSVSAAVGAPRPNVLLICVDDLRPELGCYGCSHVRTPNIDRLAARGMRFDRAYVQVSQCGPSRLNLMTGLRPDTLNIHTLESGRFRRSDFPDIATLGEHFKRAGYHTQALGKVFHNGRDDPQSWSVPTWENDGRNFMFFYVDEPKLAALRGSTGGEIRPQKIPARTGHKITALQSPDVDDRALGDGILADKAIEALRQIKDRRFLLSVGFYRPHLPFVAPRRYFDMYPLESVHLPEAMRPPSGAPVWGWFNSNRYYSARWRSAYAKTAEKVFVGGPPVTPPDPRRALLCAWAEFRSYDDIPLFGEVDIERLRRQRQAYLACVSYVDAQIGRLLDEFDRLGLRKNTIVVLWGDHGWHLGENGAWGKLTNYERGTRIPLIVAAPEYPPSATDALVETVDVFPTLAELCGLPAAEHVEGTSMAPLLARPDRPWKTAAFSQYPRGSEVMGRAVRTDRFRYVEWIRPNGEIAARELYDHRSDPRETVNLAARPEYAADIEQLHTVLHAGWQKARPRQ